MAQYSDFAVVDVETTGFGKYDRIIEIAILRLDAAGKLQDEYVTLVNPLRDVGPTFRHGITASDVRHAPVFEEVAGDIVSALTEAIFVAHNVHFDLRMLNSEFVRVRLDVPAVPYLCTMKLARRLDPEVCHRDLAYLCKHFSISLSDAHSAEADARATAELLCRGLGKFQRNGKVSYEELGVMGEQTPIGHWPVAKKRGRRLKREQARTAAVQEKPRISRLLQMLPVSNDLPLNADEYLGLLDNVLEDRRVTADEIEMLHEMGVSLGIDRNAAKYLHEDYFRRLAQAAYADGYLSEFEQKDIRDVQRLLALPNKTVRAILDDVTRASSAPPSKEIHESLSYAKYAGKTICFTGQLNRLVSGVPATREYAERIAAERGMIVKNGVTKQLDFLVVADPDSMSGKAKKARQYGIRILAEAAFWHMMQLE